MHMLRLVLEWAEWISRNLLVFICTFSIRLGFLTSKAIGFGEFFTWLRQLSKTFENHWKVGCFAIILQVQMIVRTTLSVLAHKSWNPKVGLYHTKTVIFKLLSATENGNKKFSLLDKLALWLQQASVINFFLLAVMLAARYIALFLLSKVTKMRRKRNLWHKNWFLILQTVSP